MKKMVQIFGEQNGPKMLKIVIIFGQLMWRKLAQMYQSKKNIGNKQTEFGSKMSNKNLSKCSKSSYYVCTKMATHSKSAKYGLIKDGQMSRDKLIPKNRTQILTSIYNSKVQPHFWKLVILKILVDQMFTPRRPWDLGTKQSIDREKNNSKDG